MTSKSLFLIFEDKSKHRELVFKRIDIFSKYLKASDNPQNIFLIFVQAETFSKNNFNILCILVAKYPKGIKIE